MRYRTDELHPGRTDWAALRRLSDEQIEAAVRADPDAAPPTDEAFWADAQLVDPPGGPKEAISIRLDRDVLRWFRDHGAGYQTRINAVLRAFMDGTLVPPSRTRRKPRSG